MDIQSLKKNLISVMPILDANLEAAHREYMAGEIPAGAFHYVRTRHETACVVIAREDQNAEAAFKSCALLSMDLRAGASEVTTPTEGQEEAWWQCYRDAGFTGIHPYFKCPTLPLPDPSTTV